MTPCRVLQKEKEQRRRIELSRHPTLAAACGQLLTDFHTIGFAAHFCVVSDYIEWLFVLVSSSAWGMGGCPGQLNVVEAHALHDIWKGRQYKCMLLS